MAAALTSVTTEAPQEEQKEDDELEASLSTWDRLLLRRTAHVLAVRHEQRLLQPPEPKTMG